MNPSTQLSIIPDSKELVRQSTDIASLCREIVLASSVEIQGRKYVRVEGWQAISTAHGCVASARDVRKVEGGIVATGEIRRMQDGQLIATAEGFVGEDESTWYGGETESWDRVKKAKVIKTLPKRPEYAIRAMAQTRAISRACRGCFAHVVVLMNAGLSTTPAEEVPEGGFRDTDGDLNVTGEGISPAKLTPEAEQAKRLVGRTKAALADKPDSVPEKVWLTAYATQGAMMLGFEGCKSSLSEMSIKELAAMTKAHDKVIAAIKEQLK